MAGVIEVRAPGEQTEGTRSQVLRWLKRIGEPVARDEPLVELETDKVVVELPAPADGVLATIERAVDQPVLPGDLLATLDVADRGLPPAGAPAPDAEPAAAERQRLSPAVRRLLRELALDPAEITGSGRDGRITAADVEKHRLGLGGGRAPGARAPVAAPMPAAPASTPAVMPVPAPTAPATERIPHTPMRRRIAERMVESLLHTAPHVTTVFEADLGAVLAHRARHRADYARRGAALTLTAYFVRAAVEAIRAVPEANARWTEDALEVHHAIDIGIATALEGRGLIVPVLRGAHDLNLEATARALGELTRRAREGQLTPAEVRGGTFTISNHGVSGSLLATPIIINQPQSAILGLGKLEKRVVVIEQGGADLIAIRPRLYASLTLDHRVMDGERANLFLSTFVRCLADWPG